MGRGLDSAVNSSSSLQGHVLVTHLVALPAETLQQGLGSHFRTHPELGGWNAQGPELICVFLSDETVSSGWSQAPEGNLEKKKVGRYIRAWGSLLVWV